MHVFWGIFDNELINKVKVALITLKTRIVVMWLRTWYLSQIISVR